MNTGARTGTCRALQAARKAAALRAGPDPRRATGDDTSHQYHLPAGASAPGLGGRGPRPATTIGAAGSRRGRPPPGWMGATASGLGGCSSSEEGRRWGRAVWAGCTRGFTLAPRTGRLEGSAAGAARGGQATWCLKTSTLTPLAPTGRGQRTVPILPDAGYSAARGIRLPTGGVRDGSEGTGALMPSPLFFRSCTSASTHECK